MYYTSTNAPSVTIFLSWDDIMSFEHVLDNNNRITSKFLQRLFFNAWRYTYGTVLCMHVLCELAVFVFFFRFVWMALDLATHRWMQSTADASTWMAITFAVNSLLCGTIHLFVASGGQQFTGLFSNIVRLCGRGTVLLSTGFVLFHTITTIPWYVCEREAELCVLFVCFCWGTLLCSRTIRKMLQLMTSQTHCWICIARSDYRIN